MLALCQYNNGNILVLIQAVFMQNCSSLALKLKRIFEVKVGCQKQNRETSSAIA